MGFASRQNGAFANLLDFRRKWVDTHKLDQDRVVSGLKSVVLIHFQRGDFCEQLVFFCGDQLIS